MHRALSLGQIGIAFLGLGLVAAGCGGGSLNGPTEQFAGAWRYVTGQATGSLTCGMSVIDETPQGNKILATGVDGALVDLNASPIDSAIFCDFAFDVAGPVATAHTDQTCAQTGGQDVMSFDTTRDPPDLWTFTLNSPTTAEEVARMTVTGTQPGLNIGDPPTTFHCDYQMTAHLQRVSKD
jgi:hypothetical protein